MLNSEYQRESLTYVLQIQEVQERIKFEFVETVVGFMQGWLTFYHSGHEVAEDTKDYINDLLQRVQKVSQWNYDGRWVNSLSFINRLERISWRPKCRQAN